MYTQGQICIFFHVISLLMALPRHYWCMSDAHLGDVIAKLLEHSLTQGKSWQLWMLQTPTRPRAIPVETSMSLSRGHATVSATTRHVSPVGTLHMEDV